MNRSALVAKDDELGARYYVNVNLVEETIKIRVIMNNGEDRSLSFDELSDLPESSRMEMMSWFIHRMDE